MAKEKSSPLEKDFQQPDVVYAIEFWIRKSAAKSETLLKNCLIVVILFIIMRLSVFSVICQLRLKIIPFISSEISNCMAETKHCVFGRIGSAYCFLSENVPETDEIQLIN